MAPYYRVLLYKVREPSMQQDLINKYHEFVPKFRKNEKRYATLTFASVITAGPLTHVSNGMVNKTADAYTVMIILEFKNHEDILYYQDEDPENSSLKGQIAEFELRRGPLLLTWAGEDDSKK